MPGGAKKLGKNAIVEVSLRSVAPVLDAWKAGNGDAWKKTRKRFTVVGRRQDYWRFKPKEVVILAHPDRPDMEFRSVSGCLKLIRPGPPNQYFNSAPAPEEHGAAAVAEGQGSDPESDAEEEADQGGPDPLFEWDPFCDGVTVDARGAEPRSMPRMVNHPDPSRLSPFSFFKEFVPLDWLRTSLIPATNEALAERRYAPTDLDEIFVFLAVYFIISLNPGYTRREFFETAKRTVFWNPPYVGSIMTRTRFDQINGCLRLRRDQSVHRDRIWPVRSLIQAFNDITTMNFSAAWLTCLDESMMTYMSERCPGFMVVKRKPHPFGNEIHTIACCFSHIVFYMELVEGKDQPKEGPFSIKEFIELGKVPSLVVRMSRPLWGTKRVVLLDSGFGQPACLAALLDKGLFGTCVIKKKRFWPRGIRGEDILTHMHGRDVGTLQVQTGDFQGAAMWVGALADSKHTSIMANTWATTSRVGGNKRRRVGNDLVEFQYPEYQHWYYFGRHAVDDHNNIRQGCLSIEEAMAFKDWSLRFFSYVISSCAANAMLGYNYFVRVKGGLEPLTTAEFRRALAKEILSTCARDPSEPPSNPGQGQDQRAPTRRTLGHNLMSLPKHSGRRKDGRTAKLKTKYLRLKCQGDSPACIGKVRTHCSCNPNIILCAVCYGYHLANILPPSTN